jgi:uncharacterized membrane protein YhaH (DUF805 family)
MEVFIFFKASTHDLFFLIFVVLVFLLTSIYMYFVSIAVSVKKLRERSKSLNAARELSIKRIWQQLDRTAARGLFPAAERARSQIK